ncbi:unnamed protein product [Wuchereria bancrofti]|uniref:Uncharacterized protein n=1 Tax=Wuchereria bancrofti TaxID=6293 RepID=A0A3P7G660_WUCBA|nr:unnamed protein product [Wuchereria bancrofti]
MTDNLTREVYEFDKNSRKHQTLQTNDLHYIRMKISSTTLINDWSNGQINISTNSQENFPSGKLSSRSSYVNTFTETSSMRNFITTSNISEVISYKTEPVIIESTNYNLTMESMREKNISDVIIEEKMIEHLKDNKQTTKVKVNITYSIQFIYFPFNKFISIF